MFWTVENHTDPYSFEKIGEVPKVIVAAWSAYEALRKFGFPGDAIATIRAPGVVMNSATPYDLIHVVLTAPEDTFTITVGPAPGTMDSDVEAHRRLMNGIRDGLVPPEELQRAWLWSPVVNPLERFQMIGVALIQKGLLTEFLMTTDVPMTKGGRA